MLVVKILYRYMLHFCDFFPKMHIMAAIFCNIGHIPGRIYSVIQDFSCRNLRFYKFLHRHLHDHHMSVLFRSTTMQNMDAWSMKHLSNTSKFWAVPLCFWDLYTLGSTGTVQIILVPSRAYRYCPGHICTPHAFHLPDW